MKNINVNWSTKEYLAYVLIYAAHSDNNYNQKEIAHILTKVDQPIYDHVLKEFNNDNNYEQIQKIINNQKVTQDFSNELIIKEIKELFISDEHFHQMEKYVFSLIKRILS